MQFGDHVLLRIGIAVLSLCGFFVAKHIYRKKRSKNPFVCPIKFDCNAVVNSDYSRLFGIPLEILGMAYYALVFIGYSLSLVYYYFFPGTPPNSLIVFMIALSLGAFLFSLYLISVQIFVLRKGCSWCFVSAVISILIFILTYHTYNLNLIAESIY